MNTELSVQQANQQVVRRLLMDCFSGGHLEVLDDLISTDFEFEYPNLPSGIEGLRAIVRRHNECFSGWQFEVHDLFAANDKVALRWSACGTHVKSFMGEEPTHKLVQLKGVSIYQLRDGLIVKDRVEPDNLGFLTQLGVTQAMDFAKGKRAAT